MGQDHNAFKTHCPQGHEYTKENTKITKATGWRHCRICERARHRVFRSENPEYMNRSRIESQMRLRYGIQSLEERDALLEDQDLACGICGRTGLKWGKGFNDVWHIDHEHDKPGTHRGILCAWCNTALGRLEPNMDRVLTYLAKYGKVYNGNNSN